MIKTRRLVVIDQTRETGEVLQAVLGGRGAEVTTIRHWQQLEIWPSHEERTVLVMDAGSSLPASPAAERLQSIPRVVIGRVTLDASPAELTPACRQTPSSTDPVPNRDAEVSNECCLDELFEYPDLVNAIEKLWNLAG